MRRPALFRPVVVLPGQGLADVAIELHPAGGHLAQRQHGGLVLRGLDERPGPCHELTGPLRRQQHQGEPVVDEGEAVFDGDAGHALEILGSGGSPRGGGKAVDVTAAEGGCQGEAASLPSTGHGRGAAPEPPRRAEHRGLGSGADAGRGRARGPGPGDPGAPAGRGALPGGRRLRLRPLHRHLPGHEGPGPVPAGGGRGAGAGGARRRTAGAPSTTPRAGSPRGSRASTSWTSSSAPGTASRWWTTRGSSARCPGRVFGQEVPLVPARGDDLEQGASSWSASASTAPT